MAAMSAEAQGLIAEIKPGLIATSSRDGRPNVSAKGTLRVLDDERLLFADVNSPRTVANLRENPQVAIMVLDPKTRRGCRIWGRAEVLESGETFERINSELAARDVQAKHVVIVAVEDCLTF